MFSFFRRSSINTRVGIIARAEDSPLIKAAKEGKGDKIASLLREGASINQKDDENWTALMYAAAYGHDVAVSELLKFKANLDDKNTSGHTALMLAATAGHRSIIRLLVRHTHPADIEASDISGKTALILATCAGQIDSVKTLINEGANKNAQDSYGRTALMCAVINDELDIVKSLIAAGARLDIRDHDGKTALIHASTNKAIAELISKRDLPVTAVPSAPPVSAALAGSGSSPIHELSDPLPPAPLSLRTMSSEVLISYSDLAFTGKKLGTGGYGEVSEAIWRSRNIKVAVKQLITSHVSRTAMAAFRSEAQHHMKLRDPNIVTLYGVSDERDRCYMIMELMPKGSLADLLHSVEPLPWSLRLSIANDIAVGLSFLHQKRMLHRDLKSLNVLLDDRLRAKLSDFGLSKIIQDGSYSTSTGEEVGTLHWKAPELLSDRPSFSPASDIYALGMVFWEIASRKWPYEHHDKAIIKDLVLRGEREKIPEDTDPKFALLIQRCWAANKTDRPSSAEEIRNELMLAALPSAGAGAGYASLDHMMYSR